MNLLNNFKISKGAVTSGLLALAMLVIPATTFAGFFPADRPTFTCTTPTQCVGADHIAFNSFTNNPVVGDERPFFAGSLNGANVQDRIKVQDGQTIVLRAYVHNNADPNRIGAAAALARNVKMKVLVPTAKQKDHNLVSFISADNARINTINDTMSLYGDKDFTLSYVPGSAKFDYKAGGVTPTSAKLNDTIVAGGTSLGDMNGCFQYSGYVTLQVKVKMDKPPVEPEESKGICKVLNVTASKGRNVSATVTPELTNATAVGYKIDWGDGTSSDKQTDKHQYSKDGTYLITSHVKIRLADGTEVWKTSEACAKKVTFKDKEDIPPVVTPPTTPVPPSVTELPNTGPGAVIATFMGVSTISTAAYYIVRRKLGLL